MGSLYVVEVTGRQLTRLVAISSHRGGPSGHPDRTRIQLNAHRALFVARADGGGAERLTAADVGDSSWSPDGRRVAFAKTEELFSGSWSRTGKNTRILTVASAGSRAHSVTRAFVYVGEIDW